MDRKALVKKLNSLFCALNKGDRKYTEVWLSDVDFGGWYHSDKYVILHVKAEHVIGRCFAEIKNIVQILHKNLSEEFQYIWRVAVYDASENIHCEGEEIIVYDEATAC
jgi:hypothetical protein